MALYGMWLYIILFVVIFCETGLVVTPVPARRLAPVRDRRAGGAPRLAAAAPIDAPALLYVAGVLGDAVNYSIGHRLGPAVFTKENPGS